MASGIYNRFFANLMNKVVDLTNDTIKVALLTSSHSFDPDHDTWSQVSTNEISGTGYTAGGATLSTKSVTEDDTNDLAKWDADPVTWSTATITARHAVIYDTTATNNLIASIDFGSDKTSTGADFTIDWHTDGILYIEEGTP